MTMKLIIINDDKDSARALCVSETEGNCDGATRIFAGQHQEFTIWNGKTITINEMAIVRESIPK